MSTPAPSQHDDGHLAAARIVLRPMGTPLPLGFLGLLVATLGFSALQLGWIPASQGNAVAIGVLVSTVPMQLVACMFGFLARDPVAGTGMGVLAGTWAAASINTLLAPAGATSPGLGVLFLAGAAAMVVPAVAATSKLAASAVMGTAALRFAVTGIAQVTGSSAWLTAAGVVGLLLACVAFYAALGFELEDARHKPVLPLGRRAAGSDTMSGTMADELHDLTHEAGVRKQL